MRSAIAEMTPGITAGVADRLAAWARDQGAGLLVTPSRRTGADNAAILADRLTGLPARIWDGTGENPYFGMLALADVLVVTADSVNMLSEAAATGKPVYVIGLEGGNAKFARFHRTMAEAGVTRPFGGALERWHYEPVDDTGVTADTISRLLHRRRIARSGSATDIP